MVVIAHTPKRDSGLPLTQNDLAGSSKLMSFFDSGIVIGLQANGKSVREIAPCWIYHPLRCSAASKRQVNSASLLNPSKPLPYRLCRTRHTPIHLNSFEDSK